MSNEYLDNAISSAEAHIEFLAKMDVRMERQRECLKQMEQSTQRLNKLIRKLKERLGKTEQ
jgi:hypothetical protein